MVEAQMQSPTRRSSSPALPIRSDARSQVGSLLLGLYDDGELRSLGGVGIGWTKREGGGVANKAAGPLGGSPVHLRGTGEARPMVSARRGQRALSQPAYADVEFAEITPDGRIRHAAFVGLRSVRI